MAGDADAERATHAEAVRAALATDDVRAFSLNWPQRSLKAAEFVMTDGQSHARVAGATWLHAAASHGARATRAKARDAERGDIPSDRQGDIDGRTSARPRDRDRGSARPEVRGREVASFFTLHLFTFI